MYVFIAEDDGIIGSEYMLFSHLFSKIIPRSCEIKQTSKMKFILCCYHDFDIGILIISFYRLFPSQFIPQSVSTHKNCIFMCLCFFFYSCTKMLFVILAICYSLFVPLVELFCWWIQKHDSDLDWIWRKRNQNFTVKCSLFSWLFLFP